MFEDKLFHLKNGNILLIRDVRKEEAQQVLNYLEQIADETDLLTFGPGELETSITEQEILIEYSLKIRNQIRLVAEVDKKIVGFLRFTGGGRPRIRHQGEFGVSVLRKYQGLGIGTKLIECLVDWAGSTSMIRKINLKVRSDNNRAIQIYKKLGFVAEGVATREYFVSEKFYDAVLMGLRID